MNNSIYARSYFKTEESPNINGTNKYRTIDSFETDNNFEYDDVTEEYGAGYQYVPGLAQNRSMTYSSVRSMRPYYKSLILSNGSFVVVETINLWEPGHPGTPNPYLRVSIYLNNKLVTEQPIDLEAHLVYSVVQRKPGYNERCFTNFNVQDNGTSFTITSCKTLTNPDANNNETDVTINTTTIAYDGSVVSEIQQEKTYAMSDITTQVLDGVYIRYGVIVGKNAC